MLQPNDFNVDELLGSCFVGEYLESDPPPMNGVSSESGPLSIKEEDLEPFRDLVSLPFDAVMDTLDPALEAASDSGLSNDNLADMMVSEFFMGESTLPSLCAFFFFAKVL